MKLDEKLAATRSCIKKFLLFADLSFCAAVYLFAHLHYRVRSKSAENKSFGTSVLH